MPLASPKKGEKQNDFVSRCMSSDSMGKEFPDNKQRTAVCMSQWRKSKESLDLDDEGEFADDEDIDESDFDSTEEKAGDWHSLRYAVPIIENAYLNNRFIIKGVAINETTTLNNHKYIAEELEKAAPTLVSKPMLKDHNNSVDSIVGKVIESAFDAQRRNIRFTAEVMDKQIQEMIKDGRLNKVSIGAYAQDLIQEESGAYVAKGIQIKELSFVAVPGDDNAEFGLAMSSNYGIKESVTKEKMMNCPECDYKTDDKEKMAKHKKEKHSMESHDTLIKEATERRSLRMTEENNLQEQFNSEKQKMLEEKNKLFEEKQKMLEELNTLKLEKRNAKIAEYNALCSEKKVKGRDVANVSEEALNLLIEQLREIKVVEEKKEMKSVVSTTDEDLEGVDNFVIERSENGKAYAMFEMPNIEAWRKNHKNYIRSNVVNGR